MGEGSIPTAAAVKVSSARGHGGFWELRLVLPQPVVGAVEVARLAPRLRAYDPLLPNWLSVSCGGCWRFRVHRQLEAAPDCGGADCGDTGKADIAPVHRARYVCTAPGLPVAITVVVHVAVVDGDCTENNALRLGAEKLRGRVSQRLPLGDSSFGFMPLSTVYCGVSVEVSGRPGPLRVLALGLPALLRPLLAPRAATAARQVVEAHWRRVALRGPGELPDPRPSPRTRTATSLDLPTAALGGGAESSPLGIDVSPAAPQPSPSPTAAPPRNWFGIGEPVPTVPTLPSSTSDPALKVRDSAKLHNGFLYKLGDGLLNQSWNLRYFLLNGPTLLYYKSQHEARPRDTINLVGASVRWAQDQSRPFAFAVDPPGQRSLLLSGNDHREATRWYELIIEASKLAPEPSQASLASPAAARCSLADSNGQLLGHDMATGLPILDDLDREEAVTQHCDRQLKLCAQLLLQAACGEGYRLQRMQGGVRIFERVVDTGATAQGAVTLLLLLLAVWAAVTLSPHKAVFLTASTALLLRLAQMHLGFGADEAPAVCAVARMDCAAEELREVLADPTAYAEWRPGHLQGLVLSLPPVRDEVICLRFELGLLGLLGSMRARRRWARGEDGVRMLLSVSEPRGEGSGVHGLEGFAVLPGEDSCCSVVWFCALDLLPWAPHWLRLHCAARRVAALAGLQEWLACHARGRPSAAAGMRDEAPPKAPSRRAAELRPYHRAAAGGLCAPQDLERAALSTRLLSAAVASLLSGSSRLQVLCHPCGLLDALDQELPSRYAARFAYAKMFLPIAAENGRARDRLQLVLAFVVAGLHLAAGSYPHLPWRRPIDGGELPTRHATTLPDGSEFEMECAEPREAVRKGSPSARLPPRCSFELRGQGYRVFGCDEVLAEVDPPGGLRFTDRSVTTLELTSASGSTYVLKCTAPSLRVRPHHWTLGRGSVFEWLGPVHLVDVAGALQCDLAFGPAEAADRESSRDAISGAVRDAHGIEVGKVRGSWLGPLFCDSEVMWRGPRLCPPPY